MSDHDDPGIAMATGGALPGTNQAIQEHLDLALKLLRSSNFTAPRGGINFPPPAEPPTKT